MIADVYEAIDRMLWALLAWIAVGAALGTLLLLGVAAGIARAWRAVRKRLSARLRPSEPESVPHDPEAVQRPSEALWALDPHDTGENPKPSVPV